jgi:hypothetical protein
VSDGSTDARTILLPQAAGGARCRPLHHAASASGRPAASLNYWRSGCEGISAGSARHMLPSGSNRFLEAGMSTKSEPSPQKRSNWYDDPRMTAEQKREAVKQFHDWCEREGLLPPQGS